MTTTPPTWAIKLNSISCLFSDYDRILDNGLERAVSTLPGACWFSLCVVLQSMHVNRVDAHFLPREIRPRFVGKQLYYDGEVNRWTSCCG